MARGKSFTTTDHEVIRKWVEERGGRPCAVGVAGRSGIGQLRIDFPGFGGGKELHEISWDEFFRKFDDEGLAFIYQEETAAGERSNFNKMVRRETAAAKE